MSGATERLVFSQSVEALFVKRYAHKLSAEARGELRQLGLDIDRKLLPAYPVGNYNKCVEVLARAAYPAMSISDASYELGKEVVYGMEETMVGRAMIALAKVAGPRKAVLRAARNGSATSNYCKVSVNELSPSHFHVVAEPFEAHPEFMQGALYATGIVSGAKNPKVTISLHDRAQERVEYDVSWDE